MTKVLDAYSVEFDEEAASARVAARRGTTPETLIAQWRAKANRASSQGHLVHSQAEEWVHEISSSWGNRDSSISISDHPKIRGLALWFLMNRDMFYGSLDPEVRIVHPDFLIAGTIDLIASSFRGAPAVIDYKTNAHMDVIGYGRNMLPPFQRGRLALPDAPAYRYFLQVNIYRRILSDCYDFHAERMVIVHLEGDGEYQEYDVPQMDEHVDRILEDRLEKINER